MLITTQSAAETKKIARLLAQTLRETPTRRSWAIALMGALGAGKTTFAQGFAAGLGIRSRVLSPTFTLVKSYELNAKYERAVSSRGAAMGYGERLVHIDCYRIGARRELARLGLKEIFNDPNAIIIIEWADRIKSLLPGRAIYIYFEQGKNARERRMRIEQKS